ncbi:RICIN domain-containing protein [Hymenobacter sp. BRD67]|uniref:RICIN domain-containing protein n=1 Tax=Hymenobacter sp. BRD67 TaxID=2675877 RepID=UPI001565FE42|nr:RICIN domain-containing protein [Hymenobacter sp. BRD67]QKG52992.1 RICIN domain-containing protein [Hymenobacter sp. BRD67]
MKFLLYTRLPLVAAGLALLPSTAFRPASIQATEAVSVWLTTGDQTKLLAQQPDISFAASSASASTTITLDDHTTYQTIDGFGAAMTGSAAYMLNQKMSASQRDALLSDLFTSSGIRLSFVRHSIGASDFSAYGDYTYDDVAEGQTDTGLSKFGLGNDLTDVVPMLKAALGKNNTLKVLGTPWSAPAWMKEAKSDGTHSVRGGGYLNTAYYQAYANYFVQYVRAYAAQGVPIYAMTLQNEPGNSAAYMSMRMDPGNEAAFLKNNIGPAFASASPAITTKLVVYDHNWDDKTPTINNYVESVLSDAAAASYAAGSAWHGYSDPSGIANMTTVHNAYPSKDIWFTEITGSVGSSFAGDLKWHMSNIIIGNTRNWAKSALEWNLALDQNSGPTNGGTNNCRGVVTINNSTGAVTRNVEYYALGHASKFVDPGAVRIASNSVAGGIEDVAFKNPDGSRVLIALNNSSASNTFQVSWNGQSFTYTLPAGAVATYKWNTSDVPLGRVFEISAKSNGKALEITGASSSNNALLRQATWGSAIQQKWHMVDAGNGYVRIVNQNSNKSLEIVGAGTTNGNQVEQYDWQSIANQYWLVQQQSDGTYRILNKNSGKALDTPSASEGANLQQWDWTGADNQRWWLSDQGAARTGSALATSSAALADTRLRVYPVPVAQELAFDYVTDTAETLQVQLLDALGRSALAAPAVAVQAGTTSVHLGAAGVAPGAYVLRVITRTGTLTQRVLVTQ